MLINLIRHTTPDIQPGICYGQKDIGLAKTFEQERNVVLSQLHKHYDIVYSSPLKRCQQLASLINTTQLLLRPALMEVSFGDWEGKAWHDIPRSQSQAWTDDFINVAPPNGESLLEMQQRIRQFIKLAIESNSSEHIVIVTHAGVIRLFLAWALNIPLQNIFQIKLAYGSIIEMNYQCEESKPTVSFL